MKLTAEASEACGGGSEPENSGIEAEMEEVGEDEEKDFQFSGEVRTTEDIGRLRAVMANEITNLAQKLASVRMAATLEGVSEANKERDLFIQGRMHKKPAYSDFLSKLTWLASAKSYKDDRDKWIRWYENKIERLEKYDASKLDAEGKERYFVAVKRNRNGLEYLLANQAEGPMPQDLFAIILPFVSDDCYPESILKTIPLVPARAGCDNLGQWVEMFGGEMIADMFDDGIGVQELSEEEIENFTVDTLKRLKKTFAGVSITKVFPETKASEEVIAEYRANQQFRKYDQKNPAAAEAFAEAFYRTSFTEKNLFRVDKGRRINKAEENGYRAFRQAISPEGDAEYAKARAAGKSDKDAMAAFWEFVRTHQTSKKDSVAKIAGDQTGLVLASGRKISWRIAIMKQQAKELEWADGTKDRLKAVLVSMGIGLEFVKAL
jgi:hypothetical protein